MKIEIFPNRKARSDSVLKSFTPEIQDEIGDYAHGRSLADVQKWLDQTHHVKPALSAISGFLAEFRVKDQRESNCGALHGLVAPLESESPDLTLEELQRHAERYFIETIIAQTNISAWHQYQRIVLKREELELKREKLALERDKSYADKLRQLRIVMSGDRKEEPASNTKIQTPNTKEIPNTNLTPPANISQPTSNVEHRVGDEQRTRTERGCPQSQRAKSNTSSTVQCGSTLRSAAAGESHGPEEPKPNIGRWRLSRCDSPVRVQRTDPRAQTRRIRRRLIKPCISWERRSGSSLFPVEPND